MSKASTVQANRLFTLMRRRAAEGREGLPLSGYMSTLDFRDREQLEDALARLQRSGHIRIDGGGESPSITITKDRYGAHERMKEGYILPMPRVAFVSPISGARAAPGAEKRFHEEAAPAGGSRVTVSFPVSRDEHAWLLDELDRTDEPVSLMGLCRSLMMAEIDRRRADPSCKHRLSARVLRAQREDGRPLDAFVTAMIEVGLDAFQMNRRGL